MIGNNYEMTATTELFSMIWCVLGIPAILVDKSMGAPNFLIPPHNLVLSDCASNLDGVNFVCVARESDYITWIVNDMSQDDIRGEGTCDVTYSSLPVSRLPNGSIIVCKARGSDGNFIYSESVSFTLYPCPVQPETSTENEYTASGAEVRSATTSGVNGEGCQRSSNCTVQHIIIGVLSATVLALVLAIIVVAAVRAYLHREHEHRQISASIADKDESRIASDGDSGIPQPGVRKRH